LGFVDLSPQPPVWRMEASRFDLTLPRTLFTIDLNPPLSSYLTIGMNFSTSHEGNVSCEASCIGGCGSSIGASEQDFYPLERLNL